MSLLLPVSLPVLLLLPGAVAIVPCTGCRRPAWSWDTVGHMAFTHTCNVSGLWSEEALNVLSKFPMVNIERFMGQHQRCFERHRSQWGPPGCWLNNTHGNPACNTGVSGAHPVGCNCSCEEAPVGSTVDARGLYVEDHTLAALRQLKDRNPNISTIFYHGMFFCLVCQPHS